MYTWNLDHGYHVREIEFEIESVPTCQEPCCKRDIQLAYMSSLVLLIGRRRGTESRTASKCGR